MNGDEVRYPGSAKRHRERSLEGTEVDSGRRIERPGRAATKDDRVEVVGHRKVAVHRRRDRPRQPKPLVVAGTLGERHERELDRRHVDRAGCRLAAGAECGRAGAEGHDGERKLLRPVGANQPCDGRVGEAGQEPGQIAARFGEGECVREHRAGVPVEVPEPALRVPPARPPRDPGDHDGRGVAGCRGSDVAERMSQRVIPVDAIAQPGDATRRQIQLEREQTAGRPGGAKQEPPAVPAHGDAHDPGREVEEAGEPFQVEWPRNRSVAPCEEVDRRSADERPCRRQLDRGKAVWIDLAMGRERRAVVGGEVLPYQRMVDRQRPIDSRDVTVGAQTVVQPRGVAGSHAAESLIAASGVASRFSRVWLDRHRPRLGQHVCLHVSGNNRYRGWPTSRDSPVHRADLNRRLGLAYLSGAEEWSRIMEGRWLTSRRAARGAQPLSGPTALPPRRAGRLRPSRTAVVVDRGDRRPSPDPSCLAGRAATPHGPQGLATRH